MDANLKTSLWQQFGAALDMLDDAIRLCPEPLWTAVLWKDPDDVRYGQYWYIAYHALSWTALFQHGGREGFTLPPPFIRGALPEQPYTQAQVRGFLVQCREKCQAIAEGLTDEQANRLCPFEWMEPTYLELQLYSMRHVQEHAAQLNLLLGEHDVEGLDWVAQARNEVP